MSSVIGDAKCQWYKHDRGVDKWLHYTKGTGGPKWIIHAFARRRFSQMDVKFNVWMNNKKQSMIY